MLNLIGSVRPSLLPADPTITPRSQVDGLMVRVLLARQSQEAFSRSKGTSSFTNAESTCSQ